MKNIFSALLYMIALPGALICLCAAQAAAENSAEETAAVLKIIAADKTENLDLRRESIFALLALEAHDAAFFGNIARDKGDDASLRGESLQNLALSGATDTALQQTLSAIVQDKSDSNFVREMGIFVASRLGVESCGLKDELLTVCGDRADAASMRCAAVRALAISPGSDSIQAMVAILNNSEEDGKVRIEVLAALDGSTDAGYISAVKNLILANLSPEETQVDLSRYVFSGETCPLGIRLRAINAVATYSGNAEIVNAVKAVAADASDDEKSRLAAVNALGGRLAETSATETLTGVANNTENAVELRLAALKGVCNVKSGAGYSLACNYVSDGQAPAEMRKCAVILLSARIPRSRHNPFEPRLEQWDDCVAAASALLMLAKDDSEEMDLRASAVEALRFTTDAGALQALRNFIQDKSIAGNLRIIAIQDLSLDSGSVSILQSIASDESEAQNVKAAIAKAIATPK